MEQQQDEVTWDSVQEVFDKNQDRSWQLPAEDLTICLRPDGSDWVLGSGGFGMVRPPLPALFPSTFVHLFAVWCQNIDRTA